MILSLVGCFRPAFGLAVILGAGASSLVNLVLGSALVRTGVFDLEVLAVAVFYAFESSASFDASLVFCNLASV